MLDGNRFTPQLTSFIPSRCPNRQGKNPAGEPRAESRKLRAGSREQSTRAASREPRATSQIRTSAIRISKLVDSVSPILRFTASQDLTPSPRWHTKGPGKSRGGETGRRTGLKIPRGQPHEGSIPSPGTIQREAITLPSFRSGFQPAPRVCPQQCPPATSCVFLGECFRQCRDSCSPLVN